LQWWRLSFLAFLLFSKCAREIEALHIKNSTSAPEVAVAKFRFTIAGVYIVGNPAIANLGNCMALHKIFTTEVINHDTHTNENNDDTKRNGTLGASPDISILQYNSELLSTR
jgi:hypothetical protein